jgi:CubicO group peptidase (beta-lactamase class C family)
MNASEIDGFSNQVTSDSIFRIASVSKSFAMFSAIVAENKGRALEADYILTLDTPVRHLLPEFSLPETDWKNGGSEITLSMLVSHTSGLTREAYSTPFNMVRADGKADAATIGAAWASVTPSMVIEHFKTMKLMFAPGQRAACKYKNLMYKMRRKYGPSGLDIIEKPKQRCLMYIEPLYVFFHDSSCTRNYFAALG